MGQGDVDVFLNNGAGSAAADSCQRIEAAFARTGTAARVVAVPGRELAKAAAASARAGRTIVAAGGDGTVSTIAGVAAANGATFGVIPLGTLNHFAKDAGIPLDVDDAVETIAGGLTTPLDIARANDRLFVNNASAGFYARIVRERLAEQRRGHAKWTAFAMALTRAWMDYRPLTVHLTVDGRGEVVRTPFVFVGNGDYVIEGVAVGRRTSIASGTLSVYTAPDCSRADMLNLLLHALAGRMTADVPLEVRRACDITIETASHHYPPLAIDGELVNERGPIRCRVEPGALRTLRPASTDAARLTLRSPA